MARIVKTSTLKNVGFTITNYYESGTSESNTIMKDDVVTIDYVEGEEEKSVTGRISEVNMRFLKSTKRIVPTAENFLSRDGSVVSITVDASKARTSKLVTIPARPERCPSIF